MNYFGNAWGGLQWPQPTDYTSPSPTKLLQDYDTNMNVPSAHHLRGLDLQTDLPSQSEPTCSRKPFFSNFEMNLGGRGGQLALAAGEQMGSEGSLFVGQSCDSVSLFENLATLVHLPLPPANQDTSNDNSGLGDSTGHNEDVGYIIQKQNMEMGSKDETEEETQKVHQKSDEHRSRCHLRSKARNQTEKERRKRINEKIYALHDLIPNANKGNKVSMLNDAVEYVKALRQQVVASGSLRPTCAVPTPTGQYFLLSDNFSSSPGYTTQGTSSFPFPPSTQSFIPNVLCHPCMRAVSPLHISASAFPQRHRPMDMSHVEPNTTQSAALNGIRTPDYVRRK